MKSKLNPTNGCKSSKNNNDACAKYEYSGRMLELVEGYNAVVQLLIPKYPWYLYPGHLIYTVYRRYMKYYKGKFRLVPMPNLLYELLIKNEFIKSEHIAFASQEIFDEYAESAEVNFVNFVVSGEEIPLKGDTTSYRSHNGDTTTSSEMVVKQIMHQTPHTILAQILPLTKCQSNCIFIQENFYSNLKERFRSGDEKKNPNLWVKLEHLNDKQTVPKIATKAHIYVLNNPHELPSEVTELILSNYFNTPRILHRAHTYRIEVNAKLVGTTSYAHYYPIFAYLKQVHFRCVNLEVKGGEFEMHAVVCKSFSTLVQIENTHSSLLPRQVLDNVAIVENYPMGLKKSYAILRSSIDTFLPRKSTCLSSKHIYPLFLLQGERGTGKTKLTNAVAQDLGMHLYCIDCAEIVSQVPSHTEIKLKAVFAKSLVSEPLLICFQNFEIFGIDNEGNEDLRLLSAFHSQIHELFSIERKHPIIIVAQTNEKYLKPMIRRLFLEVVKLDSPTKDERYEILKWLHIREVFNNKILNSKDILETPLYSMDAYDRFMHRLCANWTTTKQVLREVADKSQGLLFGDLQLLYINALRSLRNQRNSGFSLSFADFSKYLSEMQTSYADSLGAPKVPKVLWSDIGGLAKLKEEIQSSIGLPLKHMHLMGKNLRRSGILLYGPPGTGKTLVAKAVATESNLSFLSVQGPELLNMYVGQSEQNVREVFLRARSAAPCVLFLDELDSLAPNRGVAGDSGGVMDRVVSQLLAEMDGMGDLSKPIFILAATNRPDLIDPALLRPGRFDKLFYVGPCSSSEDKASVLHAQTKNFNLEEGLNIDSIAQQLKGEMSGADLYSICSNAWLAAVRRTIDTYATGGLDDEELEADNIIVEMEDFTKSFGKFIPSISKSDLDYFNKLKTSYGV